MTCLINISNFSVKLIEPIYISLFQSIMCKNMARLYRTSGAIIPTLNPTEVKGERLSLYVQCMHSLIKIPSKRFSHLKDIRLSISLS